MGRYAVANYSGASAIGYGALCMAQGWSHGEAADALGLPLGTIKSHVARGRDKLLAVLGDQP